MGGVLFGSTKQQGGWTINVSVSYATDPQLEIQGVVETLADEVATAIAG
ncbi:MAG TPA: hypothetical protein VK507_09310 [Iamia sp.]|nr:hypothetical protein [Iamia sp.]